MMNKICQSHDTLVLIPYYYGSNHEQASKNCPNQE